MLFDDTHVQLPLPFTQTPSPLPAAPPFFVNCYRNFDMSYWLDLVQIIIAAMFNAVSKRYHQFTDPPPPSSSSFSLSALF